MTQEKDWAESAPTPSQEKMLQGRPLLGQQTGPHWGGEGSLSAVPNTRQTLTQSVP